MKFKLDENIGRRGRDLLEAAGHDVMTGREQDLRGGGDEQLFEICAVPGLFGAAAIWFVARKGSVAPSAPVAARAAEA